MASLAEQEKSIWHRRWISFLLVVVVTVVWGILFMDTDTAPKSATPKSAAPAVNANSPLSHAQNDTFTILKGVWKSWLWPVVRLFLLFYVVWCLLLYFYQGTILFPTGYIPNVQGIQPPDGAIQTWIEANDKSRVEGWYLPPKNLQPDKKYPVVWFFHGNAELIDYCVDDFRQYQAWGFGVFLPEYRGYGRSGGVPGQKNIAADMKLFYHWLIQRPEVDQNRLIYHGRSLGGGVACQLAADHPPAALILQSTFISVVEMTKKYLVPSIFVQHPFRSDRVVSRLNCPIFIAHGVKDEIIPCDHGQRLAQLAPKATFYEVACHHNDFPMDKTFWQKIQQFLAEAGIL